MFCHHESVGKIDFSFRCTSETLLNDQPVVNSVAPSSELYTSALNSSINVSVGNWVITPDNVLSDKRREGQGIIYTRVAFLNETFLRLAEVYVLVLYEFHTFWGITALIVTGTGQDTILFVVLSSVRVYCITVYCMSRKNILKYFSVTMVAVCGMHVQ